MMMNAILLKDDEHNVVELMTNTILLKDDEYNLVE
jgi:hypothetical protein